MEDGIPPNFISLITNKKNPVNFVYNIHKTALTKVDSANYLGVIINSKLNRKKQYSYHKTIFLLHPVNKHFHLLEEIYLKLHLR